MRWWQRDASSKRRKGDRKVAASDASDIPEPAVLITSPTQSFAFLPEPVI